jgi:hypothetical protein
LLACCLGLNTNQSSASGERPSIHDMTDAQFDNYIAQIESSDATTMACQSNLEVLPGSPASRSSHPAPAPFSSKDAEQLHLLMQNLSPIQIEGTLIELIHREVVFSHIIHAAKSNGLALWIGFEQLPRMRSIAREERARQLMGLSVPINNLQALLFSDARLFSESTTLVVQQRPRQPGEGSALSLEEAKQKFEEQINSVFFQLQTGILFGPRSPWIVITLTQARNEIAARNLDLRQALSTELTGAYNRR